MVVNDSMDHSDIPLDVATQKSELPFKKTKTEVFDAILWKAFLINYFKSHLFT